MMRIGNNYQGVMQFFSRTNGSKANVNMPFGTRTTPRRWSAGGRNTLEDLLSGHYKNSYGVEGMVITEGSDRKRIMPVSDEMRQHVFGRVKDVFYKYNGLSGDNKAEQRKYSALINDHLKTIKKEDRLATSWTLGQLGVDLANRVSSAVKAKIPGWTHGQPIPSDVLDEIFADASIASMASESADRTKGLDIQI